MRSASIGLRPGGFFSKQRRWNHSVQGEPFRRMGDRAAILDEPRFEDSDAPVDFAHCWCFACASAALQFRNARFDVLDLDGLSRVVQHAVGPLILQDAGAFGSAMILSKDRVFSGMTALAWAARAEAVKKTKCSIDRVDDQRRIEPALSAIFLTAASTSRQEKRTRSRWVAAAANHWDKRF
jgi:hypothetical protein